MDQNVRGLRTNMLTCISEYDLILLFETWLMPKINNSEAFPDNYIVYHCDRYPLQTGKYRGGGVYMAMNASLDSCEVYKPLWKSK